MGEGRAIGIRGAHPVDAAPVARVHVDSWRSTYVGIVPSEYLDSLASGNSGSWWKQVLTTERPSLSNFEAETAAGDIVGLAAGEPERTGNTTYRGELYRVCLLDEYQHKGLGRRLVSAVAERLLVDGFNSMLAWVLKDNRSACRFYESLGGERIGRRTRAIGGVDLVQVFYGWTDIADLVIGGRTRDRPSGA